MMDTIYPRAEPTPNHLAGSACYLMDIATIKLEQYEKQHALQYFENALHCQRRHLTIPRSECYAAGNLPHNNLTGRV